MKTIHIHHRETVAQVLASHANWISGLAESERDRLEKEIRDLHDNGSAVFNQGGSLRSKRTLVLGGDTVIIHADFRQPTIVRKLLQLVGWR